MKARDAISRNLPPQAAATTAGVEADTPLMDLLPRLLDTPDQKLGVMEGSKCVGTVDATSLLEALNKMIAPRDDSSTITVMTTHSAYSASHIAHAVEDADTHLVDLWSAPADEENIMVTLRVRTDDPSAVVMSLQRYGYNVACAHGQRYRDAELAARRLLELQTLLNV